MKRKLLGKIIILSMILYMIPTATAQAEAIINIGDYVLMGKYYDKPILWRCVDIDANGPLMLSDKILTIKPFDANGNHKYLDGTAQTDNSTNSRTKIGSNLWQTSNIRSWLNSTSTEGNVKWLDGCIPIADKLYNGKNAYATEKGFLAEGNFTASEKNTIKSVTQKSLLNELDVTKLSEGGSAIYAIDSDISEVVQNYDNAYYHNITDEIFLLDIKQINKVYQNGSILGANYYIGKPTQEAVSKSEFKNSELAAGKYWHSYLRSPSTISSLPSFLYSVYADGSIKDCLAAIKYILGVRPAFYMDIESVIFNSGNGTVGTPYVVNTAGQSQTPTQTPTQISIDIKDYITTPTNQDIVVIATTDTGTLNETSHTFTANGSFEFIATDALGNITKKTVKITNIDKTAPIITARDSENNVVVMNKVVPSKSHVTISVNEGNIEISNKGVAYLLEENDVIFGEGTYYIKATDIAGNNANLTFIIADMALTGAKTDSKTELRIEYGDNILPTNFELIVTPVAASKIPENANLVIEADEGISTAFDISLYSNGIEIQPNGMITIYLPIPTEDLGKEIMIIKGETLNGDDIVLRKRPKNILNGFVILETDNVNECIILVKAKAPIGIPNHGNGIVILITILVALSVATILMYSVKKKKWGDETKSDGFLHDKGGRNPETGKAISIPKSKNVDIVNEISKHTGVEKK